MSLAVASVAYGLGTQAGDGTAVADSQNGERGARIALDGVGLCGAGGLADKLEVDENKLEDALRDFRSSQGDAGRDEFAAALADALGISADKVRSAFEALHAQREERFEDRGGRPDKWPPPLG